MQKKHLLVACLALYSSVAGAAAYDYSVEMKESDGNVRNGNIRINLIPNGKEDAKGVDDHHDNAQLLGRIQNLIQSSYRKYNINIHLQGDVVTLVGVVESDSDKRNIEKDILKINGVKKVENKLQVSK